MPRPNTRASQAAEFDGEDRDDPEVLVEPLNLDQADETDQTDDEQGGDEAGDAQGEQAEGTSDTSSEAELDTAHVGRELRDMTEKQAKVMEAMLDERAAYCKDRADFNAERVKMVELMAQAKLELSEERTKRGPARGNTGMVSSKSPRFNGETEWTAFLVQFETWMQLHGYDLPKHEGSRSGLLGLAMEGEAQVYFSGLSQDERQDFQALKSRLQQRYGGDGTAEVSKAKLQSLAKRQPGEDLSKLRDSAWLMSRKGYPRLPREAQEQIALDALLRAVDADLRIQCSMGNCRDLDQAVSLMQRYEAVAQSDPDRKKKLVKKVAEQPDVEAGDTADSGQQQAGIAELCRGMTAMLSKQLDLLTGIRRDQARPRPPGGRRQQDLKDVECYACHQRGHYASSCSQGGATAQSGRAADSSTPVGK